MQWSYELLTEPEQRVFERLSTFAGSFDLERAELVCAGDGIDDVDVSGLLVALVDKSMVVAERSGPRTRYRLLETLREFGRERLAARPEYGRPCTPRTRTCTSSSPSRPAPGSAVPTKRAGSDELDASFDDMREAHAAALADGDVDRALRLVVALREYAWRRIRYELLAWADATVSDAGRGGAPAVSRSRSASSRTAGSCAASSTPRSRPASRRVAAAARLGTPTTGLAERAIGNARFYQDREAEACDWMDRMLDAATALESP